MPDDRVIHLESESAAVTLAAKIDPIERHSQIEIDVFCTRCFYNLHGQVVTIDPHLNFPVCRCPECGQFHPAGTGVTASSSWMRRLASILLFAWVAIVVILASAFSLGCFALSIGSVEAFTYGESIPYGTHQWRYEQHLLDWQLPGSYEKNTNGFDTMMCISAGSLLLGFVIGVLCVALLWHWKKPRYLWAILLPFLPALSLGLIYHTIPNYDGIRADCMLHALCQTGIQCVGILLGVLLGRKISRAVIRMIIPPKPRQTLAFLWRVDGLEPG